MTSAPKRLHWCGSANPNSKRRTHLVVDMAHSLSTVGLGRTFNAFLFASIADDSGGAPLNTVSVLARLGMDPWQEAAELSRLPRNSAIKRLAALLVQMPGRTNGSPDAELTAVRLIGLLPGPMSAGVAITARTSNPARPIDRAFVAIGFGFAIFALISGLVRGAGDQAQGQGGGRPAAASTAPLLAASHAVLRR